MADGLGYITELNPTDVLFGRGSGPNDHEGNIRFRQLVADRKQEYLATNHRQTKATIAREIVNTILEEHGRFLKKVEHFEARRLGIPKGVDAWIIVDDDTVMEKAKQALRQNTNKGDRRGTSPNRGGVSPTRGNSPVRGGHASPVPGVSPVPGSSSPMRGQPARVPTFEDLEPLPLANVSPRTSNGSQYAGMSLQQQQQLSLQQQQLELQQLQQQQAQQQLSAAQLASLGGVDPTPLGWGAGSDQNRFAMTQTGGDWGGSNHVVGGAVGQDPLPIPSAASSQLGGWGGQQQRQNSMDPPHPRIPGLDLPSQPVRYSLENLDSVNNASHWGNSEHTDQTNHSAIGAPDVAESEEDLRKRRQSLHMEDLMDSMSKLQTGNFSAEAKLQESTDTMGTIEPIGAFGNSTSMSCTSFSSSTFSIMGDSTDDFNLSRGVSRSNSINGPRAEADASMQSMQSIGSIGNLSEVWGSRGMSLLDRLVQEERERAALEGGGDGGGGNDEAFDSSGRASDGQLGES